jgi:CxxC motif-containing protein (DUF1111 family)
MNTLFAVSAGLLVSCADGESAKTSVVEPGEWLPGGDTTNTRMLGANAFLMPAQNLSPDNELAFYGGNAFFNQGWVVSPASTEARDGLGPLFNARSCSGCHFRDGKAEPPEDGTGPFVGLLLQLSVPGPDGPVPHPIYGGQLQDQASPEVPVEGIPSVEWIEENAEYPDGTPYSLIRPSFTIDSLQHGELGADVMTSARIAPHMIGLGLLEAIPAERLESLATEGNGRIHWLDTETGMQPGRFGWKATTPSVEVQSAVAFAGDMGLTSRLALTDDCTESQADCLAAINGGEPEVTDRILDRVVLYSRVIAVPARRDADDPTILKGKRRFNEIGCAECHTPSHTTGEGAIPELSNQLIWPYTDLLLHDMGEGLSDNRPVGEALPSEWKTAPLWGLGLMADAAGHSRYLHDGRARNLEEAILWHGGEAQSARDGFTELSSANRAALLAFVGDL